MYINANCITSGSRCWFCVAYEILRRSFTWCYDIDTFPRYWPFVTGIHRSPMYSYHKGLLRGALVFSLICTWTNGFGSGDMTCSKKGKVVFLISLYKCHPRKIRSSLTRLPWMPSVVNIIVAGETVLIFDVIMNKSHEIHSCMHYRHVILTLRRFKSPPTQLLIKTAGFISQWSQMNLMVSEVNGDPIICSTACSY